MYGLAFLTVLFFASLIGGAIAIVNSARRAFGDLPAVEPAGIEVGEDYVVWLTSIDLGWGEYRNTYGAYDGQS